MIGLSSHFICFRVSDVFVREASALQTKSSSCQVWPRIEIAGWGPGCFSGLGVVFRVSFVIRGLRFPKQRALWDWWAGIQIFGSSRSFGFRCRLGILFERFCSILCCYLIAFSGLFGLSGFGSTNENRWTNFWRQMIRFAFFVWMLYSLFNLTNSPNDQNSL